MNPSDQTSHYRAVLARGSKSFDFASRFLPAARRDDAAAVYTFCRTVDDIADEGDDPDDARNELARLQQELRGLRPPSGLVGDFLDVAHRRQIGLRPALHLIDGALSDLGNVRLRNDRELFRYCYRVAGTVGLLMCGVLGVRSRRAAPFAVDLGIAMQLTNIARDVREDAERGRIYLPRERLQEAGLRQEALLDSKLSEDQQIRLARTVVALLEMADRYYRSARRGVRFIPLRARLAIVVASSVYREIGRKLCRMHGGNPWSGRTFVTGSAKLRIAFGALLASVDPRVMGLWLLPRHETELHRDLEDLLSDEDAALPRALTPQAESEPA
ncbi:MAG: phytoene/squalene synthase family protein [Myxococcota bacterium]